MFGTAKPLAIIFFPSLLSRAVAFRVNCAPRRETTRVCLVSTDVPVNYSFNREWSSITAIKSHEILIKNWSARANLIARHTFVSCEGRAEIYRPRTHTQLSYWQTHSRNIFFIINLSSFYYIDCIFEAILCVKLLLSFPPARYSYISQRCLVSKQSTSFTTKGNVWPKFCHF